MHINFLKFKSNVHLFMNKKIKCGFYFFIKKNQNKNIWQKSSNTVIVKTQYPDDVHDTINRTFFSI